MAKETNKGDVESICAKVTKHASKKVAKAEVNLNYWLWTIELIMICFDCVFISTSDLAEPVWYQYQCSHCFHDFSVAAPGPRVRRAWNLMGTSVRNGRRFFLLFGKKYYFIDKLCFLMNNLFGNVFQTSRVIGLKTLLSDCMWNSDDKKVFKPLEKVFFSLAVNRKPSFHDYRVISMF